MIHTWKITKTKQEEIHFEDESSLDAITRQLPEGWYSTFRTYDNCTRVIGLTDHLKRLPHADASFLRRNLIQLLEPFRPGETRIRVMETRKEQLYVSIEPLFPFPRGMYEKGVRVETTSLHRENPRVKSTAFIGASSGERKHIKQAGIHEALMVKNRRILEGMTSNFFYKEPSRSRVAAAVARALRHWCETTSRPALGWAVGEGEPLAESPLAPFLAEAGLVRSGPGFRTPRDSSGANPNGLWPREP